MSYYEFLNSMRGIFSSFVNYLNIMANSLLNNYIFITLLGLVIFISLFWLVYYIFIDFINDKLDKYDDDYDRYKAYCDYQGIKFRYMKEHRLDLWKHYLVNYDIQTNALKDYTSLHKGKLLELRSMNYAINKDIQYWYIRNNTSQVVAQKIEELKTNDYAKDLYTKIKEKIKRKKNKK